MRLGVNEQNEQRMQINVKSSNNSCKNVKSKAHLAMKCNDLAINVTID